MYLLRLITFLFFVFPLLSQDEEITIQDLFERDGLFYAPGQDSTFSGTVKGNWDNGIKKLEYSYKDGKPDAKWSTWFLNGQPEEEIDYQSGIKNGIHKQWYKNGQQKFERTYKEGIHDGKWTEWYENGQSMVEGSFLDGKPDGMWTYWFPNGQKKEEGNPVSSDLSLIHI